MNRQQDEGICYGKNKFVTLARLMFAFPKYFLVFRPESLSYCSPKAKPGLNSGVMI
jgi:hypothetical protein